MKKLTAFNHVTLDGYFAGSNGDISWAHRGDDDAEWGAFAKENAGAGGALLFGRITYEMMASYWPSPAAFDSDPIVAERMNNLPKVVFSRTLKAATWKNTTLVRENLAAEVRKLKQEPGKDMAILGSGSIVSQLAQAGLIDEYHMVVNPIAIGQGRTAFEGMERKLALKLLETRAFGNGNVLLSYAPAS